MQAQQLRWGSLCTAFVLATCVAATAQTLPFEPHHESGQSITGAFEGWFPNPDGTYSILVGYYNRNLETPMDIPVGPNNRIEPGGPDYGQPTHFVPGRAWGMFTFTVPKNFGDQRLHWTIVANGKTTVIPLDIGGLWQLSPFIDATGDTPPYVGFSESGPFVNGPRGHDESLSATVGTPLPLPVWVADDAKAPILPGGGGGGGAAAGAGAAGRGRSGGAAAAGRGRGAGAAAAAGGGRRGRGREPVTVHWTLFRGPVSADGQTAGTVKFASDRPVVEKLDELKSAPAGMHFTGKVTTTATFSEPGEYVLNIQADDSTGEGGGGFQCCWSNAKVKVSVKAGAPGGN